MSAQRNFTLSTPAPNVRADAEGGAEIVYTVANTSGLPNRGLARIVPLGDTRAEWLALEGQNEREFPTGGVHQFTVSAKFPPEASGRYSLRLDVLSARKGGEEAYAGPVVTIETSASAAPAKASRWWVWAAAAILLLIVGVAGALLLRSKDKPPREVPIVDATDTAMSAEPKKSDPAATDAPSDTAAAEPTATSYPTATDATSYPTATDTASYLTATDATSYPTATDTGSYPTATDTASYPTATDTTSTVGGGR